MPIKRRTAAKRFWLHDHNSIEGEYIRDLILGGQDGLVNTLGLTLGVAVATNDSRLVIIAGLAALFAEGISMGAVAYTSMKASDEYYKRVRKRELDHIIKNPNDEQGALKRLYKKKGFVGKQLDLVVKTIMSKKQRWINVIMEEQLKLYPSKQSPLRSGIVVGIAAHIGAIFPILPFFFLPVNEAIWIAVPFSISILFVSGAVKGTFTEVKWWRSGLELAIIGTGAALAGYLIGSLFGMI
jgi:VIT1/CCC1 family predicted Fe2+/Mn2+ transporter